MTLWGHNYVNVIDAGSKYVGPCYYVNVSEFVEPRCYVNAIDAGMQICGVMVLCQWKRSCGAIILYQSIPVASHSGPESSCPNQI